MASSTLNTTLSYLARTLKFLAAGKMWVGLGTAVCAVSCMPPAIAADNSGATQSANQAFWNPKPAADDVMVPMPCGGFMAFRKVYTGKDSRMKDRAFEAGSTNPETMLSQSPTHRYIQGAFFDDKGYYYLIAKYELTDAQYKLLNSYQQGKGKCAELKQSKIEQTAKGGLSWFEAVELTKQYSYFLGSKEAQQFDKAIPSAKDGGFGLSEENAAGKKQNVMPAFARLPTDSEWEFAARGGMEVNSSQFNADVFPLESNGGNGSIADFAWYKGADSATSERVNVVGLKKPNPLGLYDILGNVAEMTLDPFYATRTGRLHGQSGGFIVRGGSVISSKSDMTTANRSERSYFTRGHETKDKYAGMRIVLSLPFSSSLQDTAQLKAELEQLGMDSGPDDFNTVATLDKILKEQAATMKALEQERKLTIQARKDLSKVQAQANEDREALLEKQNLLTAANEELKLSIDTLTTHLSELRGKMVEANTKRDEMRDKAIISSLRLGGYLCSTIAAQQIALEQNAKNEQLIRNIKLPSCRENENSKKCAQDKELQEHKLQQNRELAQHMVDFYVSYYADHINDILATFDVKYVVAQSDNAKHALGEGGSSLESYIGQFVNDVQAYRYGSRNLQHNHTKWIQQCRGLKK